MTMRIILPVLAPLLAPLLALGALSQLEASAQAPTRVWKVGGVGGLASVQAAVDLASDGDLILVRSGTYPAFFVNDKALSVLPAAGGAVVNLSGEVHIENLGAGKIALLGGVSSQGVNGTSALIVRSNAGAVVLRDASFTAVNTQYSTAGRAGVRLMESDIVVADNCQITGAPGQGGWISGGQGMFARRSQLASFRTTLRGGAGGSLWCMEVYTANGGDGAAGYECPEGFLFAAGGGSQGGDGGDPNTDWWDWFTGQYFPAGSGGNGGPGIRLGSWPATALTPRVEMLLATAAGGTGGSCSGPGPNAPAVQINNGSVGSLAGSPREITLQDLAYESSSIPFTAQGASGERVYLMISQVPDFQFDPALLGCRLQKEPMLAHPLSIGTIPPAGVLQTQLLTRRLRPGDEAGTFLVQAIFVAPNGSAQLGNATAIAIVDVAVPLN